MDFLKHCIKSVYRLLAAPLEKYFYFFMTVLVLHALVDVVFFYIYWRFSLQVVLNGTLMAYTLTIPCFWLEKHKLAFRLYKLVVFLPYVFSFLGDVTAHAVLDSSLDNDVAATILATNKEEVIECLETYFSFTPLLIGVGILLTTFLFYRKLKTYRPRLTVCYLIGVCLGLGMTLVTPWSGLGGVVGKVAIFHEAQSPIDINKYARVPNIKVDSSVQPENVVLIIGESLNKLQCSSYGYDKPTTPKLEALIRDSLLIQYDKVISPEVHTLAVFKTLFSQYRNEWEGSVKWYTCPTLQNILHQSGYHTYWISNQSKRGVSDNFIGQYADLCTENYFAGNKLAGMKRKTYDEEVIPLLKPLLNPKMPSAERLSGSVLHADNLNQSDQTISSPADSLSHNFYVVHLMGSHFKFSKRYPEAFNHFKAEDYPALPIHQREVVATYDNSVLYNDSVVTEVMNLFADKEAIVFYFSDHAIDLYQSSPTYYGHAKKTKESFHYGQLIPFYVYVTPKYQARFPHVVEQLRQHTTEPFCTENMFYTIMNLIGTTFADSNCVNKYSLLSEY